jgi:hypothetical protein
MSESNPIRVFATHNFQETDDYLRVFEFLESVQRFYYLNVSKPENLPTTGGTQEMSVRKARTSAARIVRLDGAGQVEQAAVPENTFVPIAGRGPSAKTRLPSASYSIMPR